MCHAIPAQVVEIDAASDMATVSLDGVKKAVSLALVQDVQVGDYLLVHVGYALNKVSPEEAERTLELFAEMAQLDGLAKGFVFLGQGNGQPRKHLGLDAAGGERGKFPVSPIGCRKAIGKSCKRWLDHGLACPFSGGEERGALHIVY